MERKLYAGSTPVLSTTLTWWNGNHAELKPQCSRERPGSTPGVSTMSNIKEIRPGVSKHPSFVSVMVTAADAAKLEELAKDGEVWMAVTLLLTGQLDPLTGELKQLPHAGPNNGEDHE